MAVAFYLQKDTGRAVSVLDQALSLGMDHGYARTFIDELDPMAGLLDSYLQWKIRTGIDDRYHYAKNLFDLTMNNIILNHGRPTASDVAAESLTRKEYKVLQLLSAGRSNSEIARELDVSIRT